MLNGKKKIDYSWIIVAICFLSVAVSLGLCSSGRTMYLTAITEALNIKRGAFALNDTFRYAATTALNLVVGYMVNKFGVKKLMCAGYGCLIGFALLNSFAEELYVFYIASILLGIGLSWTGTSMMSIVVNRWCTKNKGTITGAILAANGLGGAFAAQILSPIIFEEGNAFGYRNSYRFVAAVLAVMLAVIVIFFKDAPKGVEIAPVPTKKTRKARGTGWIGMEYYEAVKKPYFYLAVVCMTFTGMALMGLNGTATPHMYDVGLEKDFVADLSTVSSLGLVAAKFLTGFMYDKIGMKKTMNISFACSFLSIIGLVLISSSPVGRVIAFVRIIFSAVALPLETVMIPLFASELFGNKSFNKVVGIFAAASTAGFAVGSPFANFLFDTFGDYNIAFIIFAGLMIFVTVTMQFVLHSAGKDKKRILELAESEAVAEGANA